MEMANAVRAPIGEKWNELPITNAKLLQGTGDVDAVTITKFQALVGSLL